MRDNKFNKMHLICEIHGIYGHPTRASEDPRPLLKNPWFNLKTWNETRNLQKKSNKQNKTYFFSSLISKKLPLIPQTNKKGVSSNNFFSEYTSCYFLNSNQFFSQQPLLSYPLLTILSLWGTHTHIHRKAITMFV